jgi:hypothetical protein
MTEENRTAAPSAMPDPSPVAGEIGILARRTIEAGIIAPIYREMCAQLGEQRAQAILDKAIREAAIGAARSFAARTPGGTSLRSFQDLLSLWTQDDALTIDIVKQTDSEFHFNVRRCRYAETYRAMGLGSIGHLLSCNRDAAFCQGYDARLKLTRTQTLMQGASHCDFRYRLEEEAE